MAGPLLWLLVVFGIHQTKAGRVKVGRRRRAHRHAGAWHAIMVTLRNSVTPLHSSMSFVQIAWAWRSLESAAYATLAIVFFALPIFAGIMTSKIQISPSDAVGRVQSLPGSCGAPSFRTTSNDLQGTSDFFNTEHAQIQHAASYVEECYTGSTTSATACPRSYIQTTLPFDTDPAADCPFGDLCLGPGFSLTTRLLDSREHFGYNTADEDRVFYRRYTTCSPTTLEGYVVRIPMTVSNISQHTIMQVQYGSFVDSTGQTISDFSYEYDLDSYWGSAGYQLTYVYRTVLGMLTL